jgi:site-specific recombinase XerD
VLGRLAAHLGDVDIEAVTADHIRGYLAQCAADGLSERTVHDYYAIAGAMWTWAERELGIPHIIRRIETPRFRKPLIEPFTGDEIKALLAAAEWSADWSREGQKRTRSRRPTGRRDIAIILVLLDSGLRASELCDLEMRDYNGDTGRLHVRHGKGDKARAVYLGARAQQALWRYLADRPVRNAASPLFATRTARPLNRTNLLHHLQRIGRNAGVDHVHPHRFRHTFAVQFLRNGGNVFELQRILGHERLDTVRVYLALAEVDIARAQRAHSPADNWRL